MIEGGQFSIARDQGLVPGNYSVAIYAAEARPGQTKPARPDQTKLAKVAGKMTGPAKELIPAKYNTNSELKAEIKKGGRNNLEFKLLSK